MNKTLGLTAALLLLSGCGGANSPEATDEMAQVATEAEQAANAAEAAGKPAVEVSASANPQSGFGTFATETLRLEGAVKCGNGKVSTNEGMPDLWGCISGPAETVKLFVNESDADGQVENVKFMWNDWTKDIGYGLHADKSLAEAWANAIATTYAPGQVAEVMTAFKGKTDRVISNDKFNLAYTYHQGPAIGERMVVVTSR